MVKILGILLLLALAMISTQPIFLLLLFIVVVVAVFSLFKRFIFRNRIEVVFPTLIEGTRGENVEINFNLINKSWLPISNCEIQFTIKNRQTNKIEKGIVKTFAGGRQDKTILKKLQFEEPGLLEIEVNYLKIDGFIPFKLMVKAEQAITIWPKIYPIDSMMDLGGQSTVEIESDQTRLVQSLSDESFGIRAYKMGDSLRQIHWKLSAKLDELVVLEQHEQANHKIYLSVEKTDRLEDQHLLNEIYLSIIHHFHQQKKPIFISVDGSEQSIHDLELKSLKLACLKGSNFKVMHDDCFTMIVTSNTESSIQQGIMIRLIDEKPQPWTVRRNELEADLLKLGGHSIV